MKYILMMTGTKEGVDTYRAWSKSDVEAHFAFLKNLNITPSPQPWCTAHPKGSSC